MMNELRRQIHNIEHIVKDIADEIHLPPLKFYNFLIVAALAYRQKAYQKSYYSHLILLMF